MAEYIVALALGCAAGVRREWDAYDLTSPSGLRVEVKSEAYIQSWHQIRFSTIQFGIQPTHFWDDTTNAYSVEKQRQADVYVFCVLTCRNKLEADPLDLEWWDFYCMSTSALNNAVGSQKSIRLSRLLQLKPMKASFEQLNETIHRAAFSHGNLE